MHVNATKRRDGIVSSASKPGIIPVDSRKSVDWSSATWNCEDLQWIKLKSTLTSALSRIVGAEYL